MEICLDIEYRHIIFPSHNIIIIFPTSSFPPSDVLSSGYPLDLRLFFLPGWLSKLHCLATFEGHVAPRATQRAERVCRTILAGGGDRSAAHS